VNLKAKIYTHVNSTIQRCSNKIIKIFLIEDFFHLPPVSATPVVNLELRISRNGPNGILWGLSLWTSLISLGTVFILLMNLSRENYRCFVQIP
jgi:hypothetical protein